MDKLVDLKPNSSKPHTAITPVLKYLTIALFITLPFFGFYLGKLYQKNQTVDDNVLLSPTPIQNPNVQEPSIPITNTTPLIFGTKYTPIGTFQETLNTACSPSLNTELLPFSIDQTLLKSLQNSEGFNVICGQGEAGEAKPGGVINYSWLIVIMTNSRKTDHIYLHDGNTYDRDHGGLPYYGAVGLEIYRNNATQVNVYLPAGERGSRVGKAPVMLRGRKTLYLENGDPYYVTKSVLAIPANDSRLTNALISYAQDCEDEWQGKKTKTVEFCVYKYDQAQQVIKNTFFNSVTNLKSPEKESFEQLISDLNAFNAVSNN